MTTRVLDWNGLCRIADHRQPADRLITLAGRPARVVPSRATDCGFFVGNLAERDAERWQLRTREELVLLRELVDAGQVTADDDEDPFRLEEWNRRNLAEDRACLIDGCPHTDIDQRGPVFTTDGRLHLACTRHWEAIHAVLGAEEPAPRQHNIVTHDGQLVRTITEDRS